MDSSSPRTRAELLVLSGDLAGAEVTLLAAGLAAEAVDLHRLAGDFESAIRCASLQQEPRIAPLAACPKAGYWEGMSDSQCVARCMLLGAGLAVEAVDLYCLAGGFESAIRQAMCCEALQAARRRLRVSMHCMTCSRSEQLAAAAERMDLYRQTECPKAATGQAPRAHRLQGRLSC